MHLDSIRPTTWRAALRGVVVSAAALAVLTACGLVGGSDAPASFTEREPLGSCGEIELGQGESVPDDAWECLDAGLVEGAELVVRAPTTEGDPIVRYYRVGPAIDGLEIFTDGTADSFGDGGWTHELCPATEDVRDPQGCSEG